MAIDYSRFKFAKGTPAGVHRQTVKTQRQTRDERESDKVRVRSKGVCEVTIAGVRCKRRAFEVHHHQGGNGVRGRGDSALAQHKTHCCTPHHNDITAKRLLHLRGNHYKVTA